MENIEPTGFHGYVVRRSPMKPMKQILSGTLKTAIAMLATWGCSQRSCSPSSPFLL